MNKHLYRQGVRKEYYLVEQLKKQGFDIVFRSAGSHSPIDIIAISSSLKVIKLVQSKRSLNKTMDYVDAKLKAQLISELGYLNGMYRVEFDVM